MHSSRRLEAIVAGRVFFLSQELLELLSVNAFLSNGKTQVVLLVQCQPEYVVEHELRKGACTWMA